MALAHNTPIRQRRHQWLPAMVLLPVVMPAVLVMVMVMLVLVLVLVLVLASRPKQVAVIVTHTSR